MHLFHVLPLVKAFLGKMFLGSCVCVCVSLCVCERVSVYTCVSLCVYLSISLVSLMPLFLLTFVCRFLAWCSSHLSMLIISLLLLIVSCAWVLNALSILVSLMQLLVWDWLVLLPFLFFSILLPTHFGIPWFSWLASSLSLSLLTLLFCKCCWGCLGLLLSLAIFHSETRSSKPKMDHAWALLMKI